MVRVKNQFKMFLVMICNGPKECFLPEFQ